MGRLKDIVLEVSLGLLWLTSSILFVQKGYDWAPLFTLIVFIYLKIQHNRRKKILPYVKNDFAKLGYEILSERPSKFSEMKYEISPFQITIGNTPIGRFAYFRKFYRIFKAKNTKGKIMLLNTIVTQKWSGENHIEIVKTKNCS